MSYLEGLNERQRDAATHMEGPLLIVAGAGAGKTKTITHRIANMIEKGIPARNILAVTFTNKAAREMRERVMALVPENAGSPVVSTFHSLGVRLLREFHAQAGLPRGFTIWDRDDSSKAVKAALEKLGIENWTPRAILSAISRQKGDGISVDEYREKARTFRERAVVQAWERYEVALKDQEALDFDDLLFRTLHLLRNSKETLALLQNRWRYLTIDEYQDTNGAQYEIARFLAGPSRNICVVGDIDQNIYSWRGADIEHLMNFEETFPGAKTVLLEQNYRSTRTILTAANSVIEKNIRRKPKVLFTDKETGDPIVIYGAQNEVDEAWFIAQKTAQLLQEGVRAGNIAVLYRENFQSRVLEEAMLAHDVPYKVLGTRFFERKEVKDVLAYVRAAMNPKNKIDLARAVAVPARGIGKVTLDKMIAGEPLPAAAERKVANFRDCITKIRHAIDTLPASDAIRFAMEASGMEDMYKSAEDGHERLENIQELVNLATKYDSEQSPQGIERLIEEAALQTDQDQLDQETGKDKHKEGVALMTVHASKGLEFDAVFVTGLEQGLFPSLREGDGDRDNEEERRLFYVALTRARQKLFLTYTAQRMKYGTREFTIPSEFIDDIDARLVQTVARKRSLLDDEDIIR